MPLMTRDEEQAAIAAWRQKYADRMQERLGPSWTPAQCRELSEAMADSDIDLSDDPADAADEELTYWTNDE